MICNLHKVVGIVVLVITVCSGLSINAIIIWYMDVIPGYRFPYDPSSLYVFGTNIFANIDSYFTGALVALFYQHSQWYMKEATAREKKQ